MKNHLNIPPRSPLPPLAAPALGAAEPSDWNAGWGSAIQWDDLRPWGAHGSFGGSGAPEKLLILCDFGDCSKDFVNMALVSSMIMWKNVGMILENLHGFWRSCGYGRKTSKEWCISHGLIQGQVKMMTGNPGFTINIRVQVDFFSLPPTLEGSRNRGPFSEAPL